MLSTVFICLIQERTNFLFRETVTYHPYKDKHKLYVFATLPLVELQCIRIINFPKPMSVFISTTVSNPF